MLLRSKWGKYKGPSVEGYMVARNKGGLCRQLFFAILYNLEDRPLIAYKRRRRWSRSPYTTLLLLGSWVIDHCQGHAARFQTACKSLCALKANWICQISDSSKNKARRVCKLCCATQNLFCSINGSYQFCKGSFVFYLHCRILLSCLCKPQNCLPAFILLESFFVTNIAVF